MSNIISMNLKYQIHSKTSESKAKKHTLLSVLSKNASLFLIAIMFVVGSVIAITAKVPIKLVMSGYSYDVLVIMVIMELFTNLTAETGIMQLLAIKIADISKGKKRLLWSSIFVTFRSKNSLCMSCFKWRLPTIIRMGTDMIIPYAHISPDCFIQTFRTGKTVRID